MSDLNAEPLPDADAFRQILDTLTGQINPDAIAYTEAGTGLVWGFVPRGHRFWDLYERWLDAGNTPLPPQDKAPV